MKNRIKSGIVVMSVMVIVALLVIFISLNNNNNNNNNPHNLPAYALSNDKVKEAYLFALDNPSILEGINCHCGCMTRGEDGRIHKDGLEDCYFQENGQFEEHAAGCSVCINEALQVKSLLVEGKIKEEIKKIIDETY